MPKRAEAFDFKRYAGECNLGKRHGKGKYTFKNEDTYEGQWKNDLKDGEGKFFCKDSGETYEGQWVAGARSGRGMMKRGEELVHDGLWENEEPLKKGKWKAHLPGSPPLVYDGDWEDGKPHGYGTLTDGIKNEIVYRGALLKVSVNQRFRSGSRPRNLMNVHIAPPFGKQMLTSGVFHLCSGIHQFSSSLLNVLGWRA